jgi:5-methylcytosine-specific restriction endonuclease McrA
MKKSSTLKSSLKKRSKEYEVIFNISLTEIREMLFRAYNKPCKYCKKKLDVTNMVCDHKHPISSGGGSFKKNLQMICASCNTKKGPLTDKEYKTFINWVSKQDDRVKDYILRKLAKSDVFN